MIARTEYLDQLSALKDKHIIKVITGIRRCGKSTLLELFRERLTGEGIPADRMVSINFEDMDNSALRNPESLHAHIKAKLIPGKTTYVFLDEVQNVVDFPRVVNSLFTRKNIDIYLTGSNAFMLSGDLATLLSGRYIEIKMLPLSFREYVQGVGTTEPPSRLFKHYLTEGGMPNALEFRNNAKTRFDYLSGIYSTVVLKDIAQHMKIGDTMMLERVIRFVFDNVGNTLSTKKIADTLTSDGRKADHKTVERYLHAMMSSFIVYQARRFDVKGKQYLKTQEKYYAVDTGLRQMLLGNRNTDWGHSPMTIPNSSSRSMTTLQPTTRESERSMPWIFCWVRRKKTNSNALPLRNAIGWFREGALADKFAFGFACVAERNEVERAVFKKVKTVFLARLIE